jgi:hypothetical protein
VFSRSKKTQPADAPYAPDECKEQQFINYSKQTQR